MRIELVDVRSVEEDMQKAAAAGGISHWRGGSGYACDYIHERKDMFDNNVRRLEKINDSGHTSVLEHLSFTVAVDDVSVLLEQAIISFRIGTGFTVKSRRYVDYSNTGFYTPNFNYLVNGKEISDEYQNHMDYLFKKYSELKGKIGSKYDEGKSLEDSRFVLPYSFNSHLYMTLNGRALKCMINYFLTSSLSLMPEVRNVGEKLKQLVIERMPFLKKELDNLESNYIDNTSFLDKYVPQKIETLDGISMLSSQSDSVKVGAEDAIDYSVIRAHLMSKYGIGSMQAYDIYKKMTREEKERTIEAIIKSTSNRELEQVSLSFEGSLSLASFTHLTRQRLQGLLYPELMNVDIVDNFIIPRTVSNTCLDEYNDTFKKNIELYRQFQTAGVRKEDLPYLDLSGNKIPFCTNITLREIIWILRLRECNNAQWEIREMAHELHELVAKNSIFFDKYIGPSCNVLGYCPELHGCGKVKRLGE